KVNVRMHVNPQLVKKHSTHNHGNMLEEIRRKRKNMSTQTLRVGLIVPSGHESRGDGQQSKSRNRAYDSRRDCKICGISDLRNPSGLHLPLLHELASDGGYRTA